MGKVLSTYIEESGQYKTATSLYLLSNLVERRVRLFLFPSKPTQIYKVTMIDEDWIVQVKKDGYRSLLCTCDGRLTIFNRYGSVLSASQKFDWNWLLDVLPRESLIDGELIGIRQSQPPNKIAIWDIPIYKGKDITEMKYLERYNLLEKILPGKNYDTGTTLVAEHQGMKLFRLRTKPMREYLEFWNSLKEDDEGVVFKNPRATMDWDFTRTRKIVQQLKLKR